MAMYCAVTGMGDFAVKAKVLLFRCAVMSRVDCIRNGRIFFIS